MWPAVPLVLITLQEVQMLAGGRKRHKTAEMSFSGNRGVVLAYAEHRVLTSPFHPGPLSFSPWGS